MLTTQSATPDAVLQPFVQCYVQRVSKSGEVIEPVFPRAGTMLIFQFADIYEVKEYATEQLRRSWAATVVGPIAARRTRLILRDHVDSLDVLFRPLGMYRLFGVPISPLTGGGAEGRAVFGPQISSLYQRLGNAESFAERVQLLDRFFLRRLQQAHPLDPTARAMRWLASGRCNVGDAARMVGISERQFERRSKQWAGVSPKALARVSRFQRAIAEYRSGHSTWLDIAHKVGYYDQMHLIRDFHDLGGGAPTQVVNEILDEHLISFCCG
ncbi:helix-turn-helix domain-containing protein [Granulicella tundricola]|jgi:AraC-like DNA-binding protein|uniref:Helix-turn-helix-domain containing protein AraC type n=1 Tax=Granulicella tundricola (strain ATCC BAA-1859 / DSM 23138 / MP5ACTX9) TaxID=1198114 RepID=E8WVR6_GRATM|nr:helix-turn-helix domain-containing protein [Granulicella tundricola]ADW69595.1 helix-turn-helix- domain containing protein AraC type [Granulicella tundricola MP5ACTX9]